MVLPDVPQHLKQKEPAFTPPSDKPAPFGRECLQYFTLDPNWLHMNNGSYGSAPKCVQQAVTEWQDLSNRLPDLFHKRLFQEPINRVRSLVAGLVNTDRDNLVLVNNSSSAANVVLRSVPWKKDDVIVSYNTAYISCATTLKWLACRYGVRLEIIELTYPLEDDQVLDLTRQRIQDLKKQGLNVKLMLLDAITSQPGVRVPWERCAALLREEQVLSLVDGAHAIGQIPINLDEAKPDFFLSNLHKWLYTHRGSAFLYVDPKYQDLITSLPTSMSYVPDGEPFIPSDSYSTASRFVTQFEWPATMHLGPLLSGSMAIEFRQWLGGEEAIQTYTSNLAKEGGQLVADILGTEVMEAKESKLTASMVNVRLPVPLVSDMSLFVSMVSELHRSLIEDHMTWANSYLHGGQPWIRLSAQIYLDLDDFRKMGNILKTVCQKVSDMAKA